MTASTAVAPATARSTGLRGHARNLLERVVDRPGTLAELRAACKDYRGLEDVLHHNLEDFRENGETADPLDVAEVRDSLDRIRAILLEYEQDPVLRDEALAAARADVACLDGDDELVTLALRVERDSFAAPQNRSLPMLLRSIAGKTDLGQTCLIEAPLWVGRWLRQQGAGRSEERGRSWCGVDVLELHERIEDRDVLMIADDLWNPLDEHSPYRRVGDAVEAARGLL